MFDKHHLFLMSALIAGATAPLASTVEAAPVAKVAPASAQPLRNYFLGIHDFSDWTYSLGETRGEGVLTSPPLEAPIAWNEMVPSWNVVLPPDARLTVEVRALYPATTSGPAHRTKYYVMGHWAGDNEKNGRSSVKNQGDDDGNVDTDTLQLKRRGGQLQLRLTFSSEATLAGQGSAQELTRALRFMGLSLLDSNAKAPVHEPNRAAWGKVVPIPERFQFDFKDLGGAVWCSPTSVSMVLAHWSNTTKRPELTMTVPQVAGAVLDPSWPGTGNWSFNASFAGSFSGIRGYVARFNDLSEVETWIAAGFPVTLSVDYGLLKGKPDKTGGHLVVCVGFTENGDAIIADPGQRTEPGEKYRVFSRQNVIQGWGSSHNTVYLIYPENLVIPANPSHHWDG